MDDREHRHGTAGGELGRVQHVQTEEERREQRDEIAEAQRERAGARVGDAGDAGCAGERRHDVEPRGFLPDDEPAEERDDDHVQRGEKRAVGGSSVGESRGVRPVGEEEQHAEYGSIAQMARTVGSQAVAQLAEADEAEDDSRARETHAHEPGRRELVYGGFNDDCAHAPDGRRNEQRRFVGPRGQPVLFELRKHSAEHDSTAAVRGARRWGNPELSRLVHERLSRAIYAGIVPFSVKCCC